MLGTLQRIRLWYGMLLVVFSLFIIRSFYLQIIKHDYYESSALSSHLKQYDIEPKRGVIIAQNSDNKVPIVLNEVRYTLFADPMMVENAEDAAKAVQRVIGGDVDEYKSKMREKSRYEVLAKKLSKSQHEALTELKLKGVLTREVPQRTYPQGQMASQLLGFVNDDGEGKYGIEEALNDDLKGIPGRLKAITDASGVPLAANRENTLVEPVEGLNIVLTIDIGLQEKLETILRSGVETSRSKFGSAVIMDVRDGSIKAMANYPTYNPAEFYNVSSEEISVFTNAAVSSPLEVGSIMKPLTLAAALDQKVVNRNTTYYDRGALTVDGSVITNVEESGGAGQRTMGDILQQSLNTGATWLLMQMGGGEINEQARSRWHKYMTEHYQFGKLTGIEQGYESPGQIPEPKGEPGLNIQYANTTFGQGMTATPLQMAGALSSAINGGTYFKPRLVAAVGRDGAYKEKDPITIKENVISKQASKDITELMKYVFDSNHKVYGMPSLRDGYIIGGKTGTAQVPKPDGGYYDDRYNGMFMGYVGGNEPQYVVVVRIDEPKVPGYAGSKAAGPVFVALVNALIDNFGVTPKISVQ